MKLFFDQKSFSIRACNIVPQHCSDVIVNLQPPPSLKSNPVVRTPGPAKRSNALIPWNIYETIVTRPKRNFSKFSPDSRNRKEGRKGKGEGKGRFWEKSKGGGILIRAQIGGGKPHYSKN